MTGRQRLDAIVSHMAAIGRRRVTLFQRGEIDFIPCWGDEIDELIAAELDKVSEPLRLGIWYWE